jgi:hypothetical protein
MNSHALSFEHSTDAPESDLPPLPSCHCDHAASAAPPTAKRLPSRRFAASFGEPSWPDQGSMSQTDPCSSPVNNSMGKT